MIDGGIVFFSPVPSQSPTLTPFDQRSNRVHKTPVYVCVCVGGGEREGAVKLALMRCVRGCTVGVTVPSD